MAKSTSEPAPAPTRSERQACWEHRDLYFGCLTKNKVAIPPGTDMSDGRGPIGKAAKEEQERLERERQQSVAEQRKADPCIKERDGYEKNCAKSWVSGKQRVGSRRMRSGELNWFCCSLYRRSTTSTRGVCSKKGKSSCTLRDRSHSPERAPERNRSLVLQL